MKKALLLFLFLTIALHAPWRLLALGAETLVVSPGLTRVSHGDDKYWDALALEARLVDLGYQVSYHKDLRAVVGFMQTIPVYGLTDGEEHTIQVDEDLHWNARFAVLAHEGGHVFQRSWLNREQEETFAEAVAMLVSHDGIREHARYLSSHRVEAILTMLVEWRAIYRAAAVLEDR